MSTLEPQVCPHCLRDLSERRAFDWLWRFAELYDRMPSSGASEARVSGIIAALELAEGLARDLSATHADGNALAGAAHVARAWAITLTKRTCPIQLSDEHGGAEQREQK